MAIEWIKVTERLPEAVSDPVSYRDVLVWLGAGLAIGYYDEDMMEWISDSLMVKPSHWAEINPPNAA